MLHPRPAAATAETAIRSAPWGRYAPPRVTIRPIAGAPEQGWTVMVENRFPAEDALGPLQPVVHCRIPGEPEPQRIALEEPGQCGGFNVPYWSPDLVPGTELTLELPDFGFTLNAKLPDASSPFDSDQGSAWGFDRAQAPRIPNVP